MVETKLFISRFGFKSGIWLLISPVPVHCFSITSLKISLAFCGLKLNYSTELISVYLVIISYRVAASQTLRTPLIL